MFTAPIGTADRAGPVQWRAGDAFHCPRLRTDLPLFSDTFDRIGNFGILDEAACRAWRKALANAVGVKELAADYPQRLRAFLRGRLRICPDYQGRRSGHCASAARSA